MAVLPKNTLLIVLPCDYIALVNTRKEFNMNIRQTLRKWNAYQRTLRELNALDNRMLDDLGLNRGDIQRIARDHANQI